MLRDYQLRAKRQLVESIRQGHKHILVSAPTGSGKGVMLTDIIQGGQAKNRRVLFLVHRRELVHQIRRKLGPDAGLILAGERPSLYSTVQLASIQTLWRRRDKRPSADIVIVDEAHHVGARTYNSILDYYPDALAIGYTATPARKSGLGLGDFFTDLIQVTTVKELTEQKWLVPVEYMAPNIPDLSQVRIRHGDYVEPDIEHIMGARGLVGHVVGHYAEHAKGRKGIVFASGVRHSRFLRDEFVRAGIRAAHIDAGTDRETREGIENDFRQGRIQVITNCQVYTEGIDVPDCSCIVLARPTKSLVLYLQMAGRGLRPSHGMAVEGENCLLIDHSGNVFRHGPVDEEHDWSLDTRTTVGERALRKAKKEKADSPLGWLCGNCGLIFSGRRDCPRCHQDVPQAAKTVEYLRESLRGYSGEDVREKRRQVKERTWRWLLKNCGMKSVGYAAHRYQRKYKEWPTKVLSSKVLPRNQEEWKLPSDKFLRLLLVRSLTL